MSRYHRPIYALAAACLLAWVATLMLHLLPGGHVLLAAAMTAVVSDFVLAGMQL